MISKTGSRLAEVLCGAPFAEHHSGIVAAGPAAVWDALQGLRWTDLRIGQALTWLRGLAGTSPAPILQVFVKHAGATLVAEPPWRVLVAMVGQPWSPVPRSIPVRSLDQVRDFSEPGWLAYGMEWRLHDLGEGRTLVETWTCCRPTDARAHRLFRLYWLLIRGGSGLIRRDMIAAIQRRCAEPSPG